MTDGYHYPHNEHVTPREIQRSIDKFEKLAQDEQVWLYTCLLNSQDSRIKTLLASIKQSEEMAVESKKEWNRLIDATERGKEVLKKIRELQTTFNDETERALSFRDDISRYLRNWGDEVLKGMQVKIDSYNAMTVDYKADKLERESVLRKMAEEDKLHHQAGSKFVQRGDVAALHHHSRTAGIRHYDRP